MKISEHFKDGRLVGYKKYIHGRNFHQVTGTSARDYQFAVTYATALPQTAQALKRTGGSWTEALIQQAKSSVESALEVVHPPTPVAAFASTPFQALRSFPASNPYSLGQ